MPNQHKPLVSFWIERTLKTPLTKFVATALIISALCTNVFADPADTNPVAQRAAAIQINPTTNVAQFYNMRDVEIKIAMVVVPDPRIPRHRRTYDNMITALGQGMLRQQFVLERFSFPWQKHLQNGNAKSEPVDNIADDGHYGVMVFRKDLWRNKVKQQRFTSVVALYLIPETATYGVQTKAFKKALAQIEQQLTDNGVQLANFGDDAKNTRDVLVIGPTYSGSLDSILEIAKSFPDVDYSDSIDGAPQTPQHVQLARINGINLISGTNTVDSNNAINTLQQHLAFKSLAVADGERAKTIADLMSGLHIPANQVAFLQEASVFGSGFCSQDYKDENIKTLCSHARRVNFPANIADVRFGLRQKQAQLRDATKFPEISQAGNRLELEDGAENGSEFPESQQSPLTAVSNQLELDSALKNLRENQVKLVVVIATDVRDRLFLFEQVRAKISNVLLIDLGIDRLLAHPDFLHASRGALALASSNLETCYNANTGANINICSSQLGEQQPIQTSAWSTDYQVLISEILANLNQKNPIAKTRVIPHIVTHRGLVSTATISNHSNLAAPTLGLTLFALVGSCAVWFLKYKKERTYRAPLPRPLTAWSDTSALFAIAVPALLAIWLILQWSSLSAWMLNFLLVASVFLILLSWDWLKQHYLPRNTTQISVALLGSIIVITSAALIFDRFDRPYEDKSFALFMQALNAAPMLGISYYCALAIALVIGAFALFTQFNFSKTIQRNRYLLTLAHQRSKQDFHEDDGILLEPLQKNWPAFIFIGSLFVAFEVSQIRWHGFRVTPFGARYDACVWLSAVITLLFSLILFLNAMGVAGRLLALSRFVLGRTCSDSPEPLLWKCTFGSAPTFASTPIIAISSPGGSSMPRLEANVDQWAEQLGNFISGAAPSRDQQSALIALFSSEVFLYQRAVFGVVLCALATTAIAYFYPITNANNLVLINLAILLATGVYSGYTTVRFESDTVLSNLLCNRHRKPDFSFGLLSYVAFPFIVLAIVIAITDIPGVLDWGGGLMKTLINAIKPGFLK